MSFKSSRIAAIGVGVVLITAGFAGCGGSDDDSGSALTKDEFIAQADQICADSATEGREIAAAGQAAFEESDLEAAADSLVETGDLITDGINQMSELTPPEGDEATIEEYLAVSRDQADLSKELAEAVRAEDQDALESISARGDELQAQSDKIADEYGFTDCGSGGDSDSSEEQS